MAAISQLVSSCITCTVLMKIRFTLVSSTCGSRVPSRQQLGMIRLIRRRKDRMLKIMRCHERQRFVLAYELMEFSNKLVQHRTQSPVRKFKLLAIRLYRERSPTAIVNQEGDNLANRTQSESLGQDDTLCHTNQKIHVCSST